MTAFVDPIVVGRVIGDVVDIFVPSVTMSVQFGSKHVTNGGEIKPSIASTPPTVTITGSPNELYTLVMVDPDVPSPSEPSQREWVHWIITDIPGGTNVTEGKEVLAYTAPRPRVGIHRYIMALFEQKEPIGFLPPPSTRAHFYTRGFAHQLNLGLPVAVVYFNSHREPRPSARRR